MYRFVKVGTFNIDEDFWELNPQIRLINPFRKLYERDSALSSKLMWCIWMYSDPSYENKVYRMPQEDKLKSIHYYCPEFDLEDTIIKECIEQYDTYCLTPAARAFKEEEESLVKRAEFIKNSDYTFDAIAEDKNGNPIFVSGKPLVNKGTATELDRMRANTLKIYEQYGKIRQMFEEEQGELRVKGGRKETLREKGGLLEDV